MLTAVMIHPPKFGATVASFDAAEAKQSPGVVDVVAIPRGVAVVGRDMWSALKARDLVAVEWDESQAETRGTDEILSEYRALADQAPAAMARNDGMSQRPSPMPTRSWKPVSNSPSWPMRRWNR